MLDSNQRLRAWNACKQNIERQSYIRSPEAEILWWRILDLNQEATAYEAVVMYPDSVCKMQSRFRLLPFDESATCWEPALVVLRCFRPLRSACAVPILMSESLKATPFRRTSRFFRPVLFIRSEMLVTQRMYAFKCHSN